ncbi:hypothetical protein HCG46_15125 [Labrenzia sp. PO1]|uniref:hypothetical protein n=1 Tax=Labrenzia sp. PO1 TaxID=2720390 RepID=UPI001445BDBE|nr:hypothetical protein [Labrenzia sp. PO1]NKI59605.1 hypothetical protein [Labrenzia sp. PO1]
MKRRATIQLFSTSSIDMLACALGAVLVLWLLVFGNEGGAHDGDRSRGNGELRIRQFGVAHLLGFSLPNYVILSFSYRDERGNVSHNATAFNPRQSFNNYCAKTGVGKRFTARFRKKGGGSEVEISCQASDAFAKEITIRFENMSSAAKVGVFISSCKASEVHYLEMQSIDRRGVNESRSVFHCRDGAQSALRATRRPTAVWETHFRSRIQSEINAMCPTDNWPTPLHYQVYDCGLDRNLELEVSFSGDGAVRLIEPDPKGSPPRLDTLNGVSIRDRIVGWAGGVFKSNRPPSLGGCP